MKNIIIAITLILLTLPLLAGEWTQYYFRFEIQSKAELQTLTRIVSIDNVRGNTVYAYANDQEWSEFNRLGYKAQILPAPASEFPAVMTSSQSQLRSWDAYPTYDAYVATMNAFAANYPSLCQIVNVGTTVNGRAILIAKISDNVSVEEKEPEVLYTGTIHGDELTGYMLLLRLIDTMLSGYGTDTRITNLVNNMEIWIGPNTNPDGTYYGGNSTVASARRANYNGFDLNRNYPNADGSLNTGAIQTETQLMMNFANAHNFVMGVNFHGGAEVVNYPWDNTYTLHPDDSWFISSSLVYANSAQAHGPSGYFTGINSTGVTDGAQWYMIGGGRQDWMNYTGNGREVTIEVSNTKAPAASTLPNYWNYNYDAMLSYLEQALLGIHGTVTDVYGYPLDATITVVGHDNTASVIGTDPTHGDFYRYLSPGSYTLSIATAGYDTKTVPVTVTAGARTLVNVSFGVLTNAQDISLSTGWNLISLNVVPSSYEVSSVFNGIGALTQIKSVDRSYAPGMAEWFNNLSLLEVGKGYWVNVSSPVNLSIEGEQVPCATTPISLKAGWNLVSYLPETSLAVATALSSISGYLQEVNYLSYSYPSAKTRSLLTQMEPGKAYWIKVSGACTLIYP